MAPRFASGPLARLGGELARGRWLAANPRQRRLDLRVDWNVYAQCVRISEVATRSGIPATTLRYYETVGLLEAQREANGYRSYDESVLARLSFLESAKHFGLSRPEIVDLLSAVEGETCTQVRETLHPKLRDRLAEVDRQLAGLRLLRRRLAAATSSVAACPDSVASCRSECMLLAEGAAGTARGVSTATCGGRP